MPRPPLRNVLHRLANRAEVALQRPRMLTRPVVVDVVLTKACNLACTFCRDYELVGARMASPEQLASVAAQLFPAARRVNVCSGGEPYLHRGLEGLLRLARGHGARTWVLSNGMLLEEPRMRAIVEEGLISEHGFSVDGIRAPTVEAIRTGATLSVILDNIDMLLRLRERGGVGQPEVVVRYALMRRNLDELPEAVRYWGERGIQRIDANYLNLANDIDRQESLYYHQEHMLEVFERTREAAAAFSGLSVQLPASVAEQAAMVDKPKRCRAPWEFVMIDATGRVLPCYRAFEALHMGTLHGEGAQPFDEIWNSADYQALRRTVNDDSVDKHYAYCGICENRRGWGQLDSHLGDETWREQAFDDGSGQSIEHRRTGYRSLEQWDAEVGAHADEPPRTQRDTQPGAPAHTQRDGQTGEPADTPSGTPADDTP